MCGALLADSYFAMRFKEDSDHIKYTPIENFARKSWTAEAFVSEGSIFVQILGASFIFSQIYLNILGFMQSYSCIALSSAILVF